MGQRVMITVKNSKWSHTLGDLEDKIKGTDFYNVTTEDGYRLALTEKEFFRVSDGIPEGMQEEIDKDMRDMLIKFNKDFEQLRTTYLNVTKHYPIAPAAALGLWWDLQDGLQENIITQYIIKSNEEEGLNEQRTEANTEGNLG